jgi:phage/plasmid-associated DNA primase
MDDHIDKNSIEAFRAMLVENENYAEALDTSGKKKTKKLPTPRETSLKLAERYGDEWRYSHEEKTWQVYSNKRWEKAEIGALQKSGQNYS